MADEPVPDGLGERGRTLWLQLTTATTRDPAALMLVHEACRVADRLEAMDQLLRGERAVWARLVLDSPAEGTELTLRIDAVLGEARLQQGRLAQLLHQLGVATRSVESGGQAARRSPVDELNRRRAARGVAASDPVDPAGGDWS